MMSSAIATRPKATEAHTNNTSLKTQQWNRIFPKQVTETYTSSFTFMKQLTTVALSTITFMKHLFPEENYKSQSFEGIELKILKEKCEDELAQITSTALVNSFEALNKKYLDKLVLCLYEGEQQPAKLVETYCLSFSYKPAGVTLGTEGGGAGPAAEANARERTLQLLRACLVYTGSTPPPRPAAPHQLTIRLYYNDSAPEEYQAPGFSAARAEGGVAAALETAMRLGFVRTGHHTLRLLAYRRPELAQDSDASTTDIQAFTDQEIEDLRDVMWEEPPVRCECGLEDIVEPMIMCSFCSTRQHAACYGERDVPPSHCCTSCARAGCASVSSLVSCIASPQQLRGMCIFRRVLLLLESRAGVSAGELCAALRLTPELAARIMRLLHSLHVLHATDGVQKIDHDELNILINMQFRSNVERLLNESQSQSEVDPVQEALRPDERSTLQAAVGTPQVLYTPPEPLIQDSTLEQYRKAILFEGGGDDFEDELPLSGTHNPVPIKDTKEIVGKRKKYM